MRSITILLLLPWFACGLGGLYNICVLGASGNVGTSVVKKLSASPLVNKIKLLNRREVVALSSIPKVESLIVNMDRIESEAAKHCAECDGLIVTMGLGASSKHTKSELLKADVEVPSACAKGAKSVGVRHLSLLSAVGSDITATESWITGTGAGGGLYNHVKGLIEHKMEASGFETLNIYRPAGILGNPNTPDFLMGLFQGDWLGKYKSIHQDVLAQAIVNGCLQSLEARTPAVSVYEGLPLFALAKEGVAAVGDERKEL